MRRIAILPVMLMFLLPGNMPAQYYPRRLPSSATATAGPYNGPAVSFSGTVKSITKKQIIVDLDRAEPDADPQSLTFRVSRKTKFLKNDQPMNPADIASGSHISLEATRDGDQKFSALNVTVAAPEAKAGDKAAEK
ncbi:MAG TPA: hypothetical protein VMR62_24010 [Bryobacteraceae bacterium]|nr:hypothetical protein [Bryobacteraceae bacterium]